MNAFEQVYTADVIKRVVGKARRAVVGFVGIALGFAAFCVAFCLLAAYELLNIYVCCAFNAVATVGFLWYAYLFFTQLFVRTRRDYSVVKRLENAEPATASAVFATRSETDGETSYDFDGLPPLLCARTVDFKQGVEYELKTAGNNIIAFREVSDE